MRIALALTTFVAFGCTTSVSSDLPLERHIGQIRLTSFLDEPDGYCLDVPGPANAVMLDLPLVAHTCHPDPFEDQVFTYDASKTGEIIWNGRPTPLCFTADSANELSRLNLRACQQSERQVFDLIGKGEFQLRGSQLCIQVERRGPASRQPVAEGQDAYGRGRSVNAQYTHLMRFLELRECGSGDPAMSRWQWRD